MQTTSGGAFVIEKSKNTACHLVALVPVGAIDEDSPNIKLTRSYLLTAVDGHEEFISPWTTVVGAVIANSAGKLTSAQAVDQVQKESGLNVSPYFDYIANPIAGSFANSTAKTLVQVDTSFTQSSTLPFSAAYSVVKQWLQDATYSKASTIGVPPFVANLGSCVGCSNDDGRSFAVQQTNVNLNDIESRLLYDMATYINDNKIAASGVIDWRKVQIDQLESWYQRVLGTSNLIPQDRLASFKKLKDKYSEQRSIFSKNYLSKPPGFFSNLIGAPDAAFTYLFEANQEITGAAIDGIKLLTGGVVTNHRLLAPGLKLRTTKEAIDTFNSTLGVIPEWNECFTAASGFHTRILAKDNRAPTEADVTGFKACLNVTKHILDTMAKLSGNKGLKSAADLANLGDILAKAYLVKSPGASRKDMVNFLAIALDALKDLADAIEQPGALAMIAATIDLANQYVAAYKTALNFSDAIATSSDDAMNAWLMTYQTQLDAIKRLDLTQLLQIATLNSFHVVDDSLRTEVTSIAPVAALIFGSSTIIQVAGRNLHSGMSLSIPGCSASELTGGTANLRQYSCTPLNVYVDKVASLFDGSIGGTLSYFKISVSAPPGLTIAGRVLDELNVPISGATVALTVGGVTYTTKSGGNGSYNLQLNEAIAAMVPGVYIVQAYEPINHNPGISALTASDGHFVVTNFQLSSISRNPSLLTIELIPVVHHLGDGAYSTEGSNSQFQFPNAEGLSYSKTFSVTTPQSKYVAATLTMLAKGVQCADQIWMNGTLAATLGSSNSDGSYGTYQIALSPSLLRVGSLANQFQVVAVSCNGSDVDDFEVTGAHIDFH